MYILNTEEVGRPSKMKAKLLDVMDVGSLSRRRQIADCHVLDHTTAQRVDTLGHSTGSCLLGCDFDNHHLTGRQPRFTDTRPPFPRKLPRSGSVQSSLAQESICKKFVQ